MPETKQPKLIGEDFIDDRPYCPWCDEDMGDVGELGDDYHGDCPKCGEKVMIEVIIGYRSWKNMERHSP